MQPRVAIGLANLHLSYGDGGFVHAALSEFLRRVEKLSELGPGHATISPLRTLIDARVFQMVRRLGILADERDEVQVRNTSVTRSQQVHTFGEGWDYFRAGEWAKAALGQ